MSIITTQDLFKSYGPREALGGVSFAVEEGEIFGFLGPNGAGKTTTINILCTLLSASSGRAAVAGLDCAAEPDRVRANIGLVFQETTLDLDLTAYENLKFHAYLYRVPREEAPRRIEAMLEMVDLAERKHEPIRQFSGGMKRRLELARGLLHRPRVLFLDEPTLGLDPQTRRRIWEFIRAARQREGVTVFMTTHYMDEAEHCDRIAILDHGRIVALDTPAGLKAMAGRDVVGLASTDDARAAEEIERAFGIRPRREEGRLAMEVPRGDEFVPRLIGALSVGVLSVQVRRPTLDDVFLKFTGHAIRGDGPPGAGEDRGGAD
ncbi:MAG TPA: ATP-binding cassette domain-containing protein [Holophaga sp.]|nr:ATP-binding cassette domain-containing protein [Holophaga sp.]